MNFVCPICNERLKNKEDCFFCENCREEWLIKNGIPSFSRKDFYWNQISKDKMHELLNHARKNGYQEALKCILLPETEEYTFNYALDESRADFKFFLPINKESRVLDLGCGWGAISVSISRVCKLLIGVDCTLETLEFVKIRKEQEGITNIQLAQIDPLDFGRLPFPNSYFDTVIMNGFLEWIGVHRKEKLPREIQINALEEVRRVLRPGGTLYIGIENRFGYNYFLGAKDDHSGLPYTSILPRCLANTFMRMIKKEDYRTYTYSYTGYKSLLNDSNFEDLEFYFPEKSYRDPYFIIPLENRKLVKYYIDNFTNIKNMKNLLLKVLFNITYLLHMEKYLIPSYSIIGKSKK